MFILPVLRVLPQFSTDHLRQDRQKSVSVEVDRKPKAMLNRSTRIRDQCFMECRNLVLI